MRRGRKIHHLERIEKLSTRQATFSKRRSPLLKEAHKLAVLVFSGSGKMYDFSSPRSASTKMILERSAKSSKDGNRMNEFMDLHNGISLHLQDQNIMSMENMKSLDGFKMLNELEQQLCLHLRFIKELKDRKLMKQTEELQGRYLLKEKQRLEEMVAEPQDQTSIASGGDDGVDAEFCATSSSPM